MGVFYDIQGVQSHAHAERGIARYLLESAQALEHGHADTVSRYLLNPDLHVPGSVEPLTASDRLQFSDRVRYDQAAVYHVGSPVELAVPLSRLWPNPAQRAGVRMVVTLYDLIPRLFPDIYLQDPNVARRYGSRVGLIRRADRILAISESTAHDAVKQLGVRPERVTVVGTGVSSHFCPANDRQTALRTVQASLPDVEEGFVLYTGGIEPRKNIDGLLSAYAALGEQVRRAHQLVIVCRVTPAERTGLDRTLEKLRIADRVLFTGFVSDELLIALYQSTHLFAFPSLYEGFGLPVAEAIASGAPVAASDIPALTELVDEPAALFDPRDPSSITEALIRCLTDERLRARLLRKQLPAAATWRAVADRTAAAYAEVSAAGRRRRRRRRRARIAFVTPLPPQRSGVADDSYKLIAALSEHCDVDAVVDGTLDTGAVPPGVRVTSASSFAVADGLASGYDRVFYCLGNSEFHAGALALLRERPGIVIAHDVRLSGLYGWAAGERPEVVPGGFGAALTSMYGARLPPGLSQDGAVDFWEANRHGILMAREAIGLSEAYLVHSQHAAQLARLDAAPADEGKVQAIPFRFPTPEEVSGPTNSGTEVPGYLVSTLGLVSPAKQTQKLLEAWPFVLAELPETTLAIVGSDAGGGQTEQIRARIEELDLGDRVTQTGHVDETTFRRWVSRTDVAVQLRAGSNGESSAVVAHCLASGIPTIVTGIGSARELPQDAAVKVDADVSPAELAAVIRDLLLAPDRRASLSAAGVRLARASTYEKVAGLLFERYVLGRQGALH